MFKQKHALPTYDEPNTSLVDHAKAIVHQFRTCFVLGQSKVHTSYFKYIVKVAHIDIANYYSKFDRSTFLTIYVLWCICFIQIEVLRFEHLIVLK